MYSPYSSAISTNVFGPSLARILAILSPILFYATANRGSVVNECMTFTHSNRLPRGCVPRVYVKICVCTTKLWYFEAWYFQIWRRAAPPYVALARTLLNMSVLLCFNLHPCFLCMKDNSTSNQSLQLGATSFTCNNQHQSRPLGGVQNYIDLTWHLDPPLTHAVKIHFTYASLTGLQGTYVTTSGPGSTACPAAANHSRFFSPTLLQVAWSMSHHCHAKPVCISLLGKPRGSQSERTN